MKKGLPLFLASFMLANIACKKDAQIEPLGDALIFNETQCSAPWAQDVLRTSDNYLPELEAWLETKTGISIPRPIRKNLPGGAQNCTECNCKTGKILYVFPPVGKEQKFIALGFRKG